MKQILLKLFILTFCLSELSYGQSTVYELNFDANNSGYSLSLDDTAGETTDYFRRTDGSDIGATLNNVTGFFFAAQDIDGIGVVPTPNNTQTLTVSNIDITGLANLDFAIKIAEDDDGSSQDWDGPDFFHVDYRIDGGAVQNLIWIEAETSGTNQIPRLDTNFDGIGEGTEVTNEFTEFSNAITGTGTVLDLIFTFKLDSGDEDIAIDDIILTSQNFAVNDGPSITDITQTPASNILSVNTVEISATITDDDNVASASLMYDVATNRAAFDGTYDNSLTMSANGTTYTATIPAQTDGSNVYYQISATDSNANPATSTSAAFSYEVRDPLPSGAIVITEIMQNPDGVTDGNGEYFEVFNNSNSVIDLVGWTITDNGTDSHTILTSVEVPAMGFAVLGINSLTATNGGVIVDYQYTGFTLSNGDDEIVLTNATGTVIDRVEYDGGSIWPDPTGAAMIYIGLAVEDNNNGQLWVAATNSENISPDLGSPGSNGVDQFLMDTLFYSTATGWTPQAPSVATATFNVLVVEGSTSFTGDVSTRTLAVRPGASLDLGSNSVLVGGNFGSAGTLKASDASLTFAGNLIQFIATIPVVTVENITVDNVNNVVLTTGLNLEGTLTLTSGNFENVNPMGQLVFKSEDGKTAVLAQVPSGSAVTGNVMVEQFFPATTGRKFRFISAPVNFDGSINTNWQEGGSNSSGLGVQITGGTIADGYDQSTSNNPSLFSFDNTVANQSTAWMPVSSANGDDLTSISLMAGDAYRLFVRGDRMTSLTTNTPSVTNTTLRATGELVAGAYPATPTALAGPNLYSLIGNPYQSKVDVQQLLTGATNVVTTEYYQWDPTTNNYVLYEFASPTVPTGSDITGNALPGQSFFVQSDATGNGTLQFQESFKVSGNDVNTKNATSHNFITINLANQEQVARGVANDIAIARFDDSFNTSFDFQEDSNKLFGLSHSIAWEDQDSFYVVNRTRLPEDGDSYELNLFVGTSGDYTFDIVQQGVGSVNTYLYDKFTNTYEAIASDANTTITKNVDLNDTGSSANNRFQIVFSKSTLGIDDEFALAKTISLYPNPSNGREVYLNNLVQGAPVSIKVYNSLGQEVIRINMDASNANEQIRGLQKMANGLYLVKVFQNDNEITLKLILN